MLQNLRKFDVHMTSLNIVSYQLPCMAKGGGGGGGGGGGFPPPRICYAITDKEDEPT